MGIELGINDRNAGRLPVVYTGGRDCAFGDYPGRQVMLMRAIAEHTNVYFLNSTAHLECSKIFQRPRIRTVSPGLHLIDNAFASTLSRFGRRLPFLSHYDSHLLHRLLKKQKVFEYVYWVATPHRSLLRGMRVDRLVYDCIDPCYAPDRQAEFDREEFFFAEKARVVFATAASLQERLRKVNPDTYLVRNACSPADFPKSEEVPPQIRERTRPFIGYMGTLDWRIDYPLLERVAAEFPNATIVIVGRSASHFEPGIDLLRRHQNVVLTGLVTIGTGAAGYSSAFDVGLIPFQATNVNDSINPVKMYMHLLAGKPVVATNLAECRGLEPLVYSANDASEFIDKIKKALNEGTGSALEAERRKFALRNTWDDRAKEAFDILTRSGIFSLV